jgi:hypothetical protein
VENPEGGNAIRLSNREQNWYALDIVTPEFDWNIESNTYLLTVRGHLQDGGMASIGGADGPWATLFEVEADDDGYFIIEGIVTAETVSEAGSRQWFRIQSDNTHVLTIHEILVVVYGEAANENGDETEENGEETEEVAEEPGEETPEPEPTPEPATGVVIPDRPANVVYSLTTDYNIQNVAIGAVGEPNVLGYTNYITSAGSPTYRAIDNPRSGATVGIGISNRENTWYALDVRLPEMGLNIAANSYQITVHGSVSFASQVQISGADSPWATLFSTNANGAFTLQGTITASTLENAGSRGYLRIQTDGTANLNIYEIEIMRVALVVPPVIPQRPANLLYSLSTDEYFQGRSQGDSGNGAAILGGTPYIVESGGPSFTVIASPLGGNGLRVSNRSADWHTLDIMLANMGANISANSYTIRIRGSVVNPPEGTTVDIMGVSGPWGRFNRPDEDNAGVPLVGTTFDTTAILNAETFAANAAPAETHRVRFAISGEGGESVYNIYEIEITRN